MQKCPHGMRIVQDRGQVAVAWRWVEEAILRRTLLKLLAYRFKLRQRRQLHDWYCTWFSSKFLEADCRWGRCAVLCAG